MRSLWRLSLAASLFVASSNFAQVTTVPKQGIRENDPRVHALTNARIVTAPGKTIEKGTVLIRDGLIAEVGADVVIPVVARPGVVAMGTKLNASISGWDNNTWDLSDWYKDA